MSIISGSAVVGAQVAAEKPQWKLIGIQLAIMVQINLVELLYVFLLDFFISCLLVWLSS